MEKGLSVITKPISTTQRLGFNCKLVQILSEFGFKVRTASFVGNKVNRYVVAVRNKLIVGNTMHITRVKVVNNTVIISVIYNKKVLCNRFFYVNTDKDLNALRDYFRNLYGHGVMK